MSGSSPRRMLGCRMSRTMKVVDVFHFSDGRTVFAGVLDDDSGRISAGDAELVVDGDKAGIVRVRGAEFPRRMTPWDPRLVAISTETPVAWDHEFVTTHDCVVRFAE